MGKIVISQSLSINDEVKTKWTDVFGEIHIPESSRCPDFVKPTCELILTMLLKMATQLDGYFPDYNSMTELDKIIMINYWREYDGFHDALCRTVGEFQAWFIKSATSPETISRSCRALAECHALFPNPEVLQHAQESGNKIRASIRR